MDIAIKYKVFDFYLLANNGGTTIYSAVEQETPLGKDIKVAQDLARARTKTKYWVSELDENGNYAQPTTAMFSVGQIRWFYGDTENQKNYLIFEYRQDKELLRVFYFKDFHPKNPKRFTINFIKQ
ncbi:MULTISPECIES: hypothetical protein [unclassified Maribacter]|uniref:hypothetical protein n=1 Tax=unclassified Maribacter TaxID=2615042 RepID=UPI00257D306A|nr:MULTISPECIES: hypothetical protein [unclassified Maribacter]|tara:strand:+ start:230 stop:604 length:375 start_codon:yes stop_codon:yes gene_type:complete